MHEISDFFKYIKEIVVYHNHTRIYRTLYNLYAIIIIMFIMLRVDKNRNNFFFGFRFFCITIYIVIIIICSSCLYNKIYVYIEHIKLCI